MSRKLLIRSTVYPYHVTARCNNREQFHCDLNYVWKILIEQLKEIDELFGVRVHAFVLMPNHFHLLISTPEKDLGVAMKLFIQSVTRILNTKSRRSGRVFGAKYHRSIVMSEDYFDYVLKYIYRNPVKGGLSDQVEDYPFSTLRAIFNLSNLNLDLHPLIGMNSLIPNNNPEEFLKHLNTPFKKELDETIHKALKRSQFEPVRNQWKGKRKFEMDL